MLETDSFASNNFSSRLSVVLQGLESNAFLVFELPSCSCRKIINNFIFTITVDGLSLISSFWI